MWMVCFKKSLMDPGEAANGAPVPSEGGASIIINGGLQVGVDPPRPRTKVDPETGEVWLDVGGGVEVSIADLDCKVS